MKKRLIIVDDDPAITSIFELILKQAGYDVLSCSQGIECVELAKTETHYDMVFLDLNLKEMSGLSVLEKLQVLRPFLPVVMMGSYQEESDLKKIYDCGAYGIIYKPFDVEEVLEIIAQIVSIQFEKI